MAKADEKTKEGAVARRGGVSFTLQLAAAMLAVAAACGVAVALPAHAVAIWCVGAALALTLAIQFGLKLRRETGRLERAIASLPEEPEDLPRSGEFADAAAATQAAAARLTRLLSASQEDRLQLEALLDSMQDAVVAVDPSGRILWTNQRMLPRRRRPPRRG